MHLYNAPPIPSKFPRRDPRPAAPPASPPLRRPPSAGSPPPHAHPREITRRASSKRRQSRTTHPASPAATGRANIRPHERASNDRRTRHPCARRAGRGGIFTEARSALNRPTPKFFRETPRAAWAVHGLCACLRYLCKGGAAKSDRGIIGGVAIFCR